MCFRQLYTVCCYFPQLRLTQLHIYTTSSLMWCQSVLRVTGLVKYIHTLTLRTPHACIPHTYTDTTTTHIDVFTHVLIYQSCTLRFYMCNKKQALINFIALTKGTFVACGQSSNARVYYIFTVQRHSNFIFITLTMHRVYMCSTSISLADIHHCPLPSRLSTSGP